MFHTKQHTKRPEGRGWGKWRGQLGGDLFKGGYSFYFACIFITINHTKNLFKSKIKEHENSNKKAKINFSRRINAFKVIWVKPTS